MPTTIFLLVLFAPGILLGLWFGRGGMPVRPALVAALVLTASWGTGVWLIMFGPMATATEIMRIAAIAVGVAVMNAGVPFWFGRMTRGTGP